MADDRTFEFNADQQGLTGDAIIDLWTLDMEPVGNTGASRFFHFINWVASDGVEVVYDGTTYIPIPLQATGFEIRTEGVPPNPSIQVSNIGLEFTGLVNEWNDLVGAKLTRRQVLARHLDGGSSPDPDAHWPDEEWVIQQKETENKLFVSFVLSTAFDLDGCTLPKRRALRYNCVWVYRGEGCGYSGGPVANAKDEPTTVAAEDVCGKRLASCRLRFPGTGSTANESDLPFGAFPGLDLS